MAYIKQCYYSKMRLFRDRPDVLVSGRWYWCPAGAVDIPYTHVFSSRNCDNSTDPIDPPLGETSEWLGKARGGENPRLTGQNWCGSEMVWTQGALYSQRGTPAVDDEGVPVCCQSLPPIPGGADVNGAAAWSLARAGERESGILTRSFVSIRGGERETGSLFTRAVTLGGERESGSLPYPTNAGERERANVAAYAPTGGGERESCTLTFGVLSACSSHVLSRTFEVVVIGTGACSTWNLTSPAPYGAFFVNEWGAIYPAGPHVGSVLNVRCSGFGVGATWQAEMYQGFHPGYLTATVVQVAPLILSVTFPGGYLDGCAGSVTAIIREYWPTDGGQRETGDLLPRWHAGGGERESGVVAAYAPTGGGEREGARVDAYAPTGGGEREIADALPRWATDAGERETGNTYYPCFLAPPVTPAVMTLLGTGALAPLTGNYAVLRSAHGYATGITLPPPHGVMNFTIWCSLFTVGSWGYIVTDGPPNTYIAEGEVIYFQWTPTLLIQLPVLSGWPWAPGDTLTVTIHFP